MGYFFKIIFFSSLFLINNSFANNKEIIVKWNSKHGIQRLETSKYKNDFYQLADYFQPQINPLYCSAATSVIILNAIAGNDGAPNQKDLEVIKPKAYGGGNIEFKSYSQLTFFNEKTNKIKDRKVIDFKNIAPSSEDSGKIFDPGLNLNQLKQILSKAYKLSVKMTYVNNIDEKSVNKFRKIAKEVLSDEKQYLVVNFDGETLGLKTNGHISPIVAFDEASDSVLVLDVAGHKNGWYWVGLTDLIKAMNIKDGANYRGYLIVSK